MTRHRIYIAGPIAGRPNARAAFDAAESHLRAEGWYPINPFLVTPHMHTGWPCPDGPDAGEGGEHTAPCYMRGDLAAMLTCDAIYLLRGWELSSGARTEFEAARAAGLTIIYQSAGIDVAHIERQREWSTETFGPGSRLLGVTDHIRKELDEVVESGGDLSEWVDVIILALDGAWRSGAEPHEIIAAVKAKQARNEARTWPDWRTQSADRAIEHDRSADDPGCTVCGRDNRNGTHSALERTGHLSHTFTVRAVAS